MRVRAVERRGAELWRRIEREVGADGPDVLKRSTISHVALDPYEVSRLLGFSKRFHAQHANVDPKRFAWIAAETVPMRVSENELLDPLHELLTAPIDIFTERGRQREALRVDLGLVGVTDANVMIALLERYGNEHLAGAGVVYNGHTTIASYTLFPVLKALGLTDASYRRSNYSGDAGIESLFNAQLAERLGRGVDAGEALVKRLTESTSSPIIVINGGPLLAGRKLPDKLVQRIASGDVRFVLHNAADIEAMRSLGIPAVIVDVANSTAKWIEAQVIGEQLAVHASSALLEYTGVRTSDATTIIKGYGLIGSSVAAGFKRFGCDQSRVVIVDPSEAARRSAIADGFTRVYAELPDLSADPFGIVIEATNTVGVTHADLRRLPLQCMGLSATSGGKGIDVGGMEGRFDISTSYNRFAALGAGLTEQNIFSDVVVSNRDSRHMLRLLNCRREGGTWRVFPKNLVDPVGQQRLVTSPMLAIAVCYARTLDVPGVYQLPESATSMLVDAMPAYQSGAPLIGHLLPDELVRGAAAIAANP